MAATSLTSLLVEDQFPDFAREEAPKLVSFVKAYYEWMEREGEATERAKNLLNYRDVDNTLDQFLQYFQGEVMDQIPQDVLVDKKLLIKRIKDLYRSKGSEHAYKLLFRIMYNEEINFYYPGKDMLRASDGRWTQETSIRLSLPSYGNLSALDGTVVTGATSGAEGKVERTLTTLETGLTVTELFLTSISGKFIDGELVCNIANTVNGTIFSTTGPLSGLLVTRGGEGHITGDTVSITGVSSGSLGTGIVTKTTDTSAITFNMLAGGSGYRIANSEIKFSGVTGVGGTFTLNGIANTTNISFATTTIQGVETVPLNTNPRFDTGGANSGILQANLAASNVYSVLSSALQFADLTAGTITGITVTDKGSGHTTLPTIEIVDQLIADQGLVDPNGGIKGRNAKVVAANVPGTISDILITNIGQGYNKFDNVNIVNTYRAGTSDALGQPKVEGTVSHIGRYLDTTGWLSYNNKLQDNYYYQEYSYVIQSEQFIDKYRKLVNEVIHPAGTKQFGMLQIESPLDMSALTSIRPFGPDLQIERVTDIDIPVVVSGSITAYRTGAITSTVELDEGFEQTAFFANTVVVTVEEAAGTLSASLIGMIAPIISTTFVSANVVVGFNYDISAPPTLADFSVGSTTPIAIATYPVLQIEREADIIVPTIVSGSTAAYIAGAAVSTVEIDQAFEKTAFIANTTQATLVSTVKVKQTRTVNFTSSSANAVTYQTLQILSTPATSLSNESYSIKWTQEDGYVNIIDTGTIQDYASIDISVYSAVQIAALGTAAAIDGTGTLFQTQYNSGEVLKLVDVIPGDPALNANALHYVSVIYSNTLLTITVPYATPPLGNGYIYTSNSTFYD